MKKGIPSELLAAAACGDLKSQREIALRYFNGKGVGKNLTEAENWLRRAAEANDSWSQCCLGIQAKKRKNLAEAEKWWRRGAEAGNRDCQYYLGFNCIDIIGSSESLRWTRMAANNGQSEAQKFLGFITFWGCGVDRDRVTGLKWMILGAEGSTRAVWAPKLQATVMKWFMSHQEVQQAYRSVKEWKQTPK
jgi:TPR repeat protein